MTTFRKTLVCKQTLFNIESGMFGLRTILQLLAQESPWKVPWAPQGLPLGSPFLGCFLLYFLLFGLFGSFHGFHGAGKRPLARSFCLSFFRFLSSCMFPILFTSWHSSPPSISKVIAQSAKRTATSNHNISKIIKPISDRAPGSKALCAILCGIIRANPHKRLISSMILWVKRVASDLSLRKKGRTDPYLHPSSPSYPSSISNAHRNEWDPLP